MLLDELVEEACCAVNHPGSLRLFSLRSSNREGIIHVTFFVEYGLRIKHGCSSNISIYSTLINRRVNAFCFTFLFRGPRRADLASTAAYVSHRPDETCCTKHMDSPYLISGMPMPSTSRFWVTSIFSCNLNKTCSLQNCYVYLHLC